MFFYNLEKNRKFLIENEYPKLCAYIICLMGAIIQFLELDEIKDENVSKSEFFKFASLRPHKILAQGELEGMFERIDDNNSGNITMDEFAL